MWAIRCSISACLFSTFASRRSLRGSPELTVRKYMSADAPSSTRADIPRRRRMNLSTGVALRGGRSRRLRDGTTFHCTADGMGLRVGRLPVEASCGPALTSWSSSEMVAPRSRGGVHPCPAGPGLASRHGDELLGAGAVPGTQGELTSGGAGPLLGVPDDAALRGGVADVAQVRVVRTDTRVREQRDAEQRVPQLLLDDLRLLEVDRLVGRGGEGLPRLVDRLVGVATVVLATRRGVDVLARGLLTGAGPGEQSHLVVGVDQVDVEELGRA